MNRRPASRTALALAVAAALSTAALLAADIAGVPARDLMPLLVPLCALWALASVAVITARHGRRRPTGPQQWIDDQHPHHDDTL